MGAFKGAVEVGAHAIETDLHISKDSVVVLSHVRRCFGFAILLSLWRSLLITEQDANLKRCFGREEKIIDCDWSFLKTLRTIKEPHEPMPRLKDLLEYLATPGLEDIWLLLDIKVPWPALSEPLRKNRVDEWKKLDNAADDMMRLIASTIAEVKPSRPWNERVILGCWAVRTL